LIRSWPHGTAPVVVGGTPTPGSGIVPLVVGTPVPDSGVVLLVVGTPTPDSGIVLPVGRPVADSGIVPAKLVGGAPVIAGRATVVPGDRSGKPYWVRH
jgi:hypothetical protein